MDKKYQIFISSTYKDLIPERNKVRDTILSMYQFPIGMEMFSAADEDQWEIIKETIDSSDYYVLIIGKRYGTVIENGEEKGISYTEKEYRYAKSIGIPILAYIKRESSITANNADTDSYKIERLQKFINEITTGREVKWFETVDQLANEVTLSLHKEMNRKKRPGWIRSDSVDIEKSLSEIVELSRQNRELQENNKRLEAELTKFKDNSCRRPLLTLSLAPSQVDENEKYPEYYKRDNLIQIDNETGVISLKLKKISIRSKEKEYLPICRDDIPSDLWNSINDDEIDDYNKALPPKESIEQYLRRYEIYLRFKENGVATTFFINNCGTAKATDISISISFPEEIRVFKIEEIEKLSEPSAPKKPEDLIQKAYKKAFVSESMINSFISQLGSMGNQASILADSNFIDMIEPVNISGGLFESIRIDNNIVEIEQKRGIVHTKSDWFRGAYIVPMSIGEFDVKVTIMCAEYETPEETVIKFFVTE